MIKLTKSTTGRHLALGATLTLGFVAACLRGPNVAPTARLAPDGPDVGPARTRGPFSVVYAAPRGASIGRREPGVTILFSRGMRAVDTPDDAGVPPIEIRTQAGPVAGAWRWTGTRGLLFSPATDLPGGSDFVVTVPAGTRSLDGATLQHPYTLEFQTDGPRVLGLTPVGPAGTVAEALPNNAGFRVDIDQPVDPAALEAATALHVYAGDGDRGEVIKVRAALQAPSAAVAPTHGATLLLTPERPLPLDRDVELTVATSLRGTGGPRPMSDPFTRAMRSHGPLRFVDFYCARITTNGRCRAGGDIKLTLSTPVEARDLATHLEGLPPARPASKNDKKTPGPKLTHWLGVAPALGATYKITLKAGARDMFGQTLASDAHFTVDVEAPLVKPVAPPAPAVEPPPPAPAQPRPPPRPPPTDLRARRERLPYRLDLGIAGQVLEANASHRIPVGAVNIPTYASLATALNEEQATAWMTAHDRDFLARNAFTPSWTVTHADTSEREVDFLDLDAALAHGHGHGPALLALLPPGGESSTMSMVSVTDLGVTAKLGPYGGLVWVTHLSTGKPAAGASVSVRTKKDGLVFEAKANDEGVVTVPVDRFDATVTGGSDLSAVSIREDAAIIVRSGDDWTVTQVKRSQADARLTPEFSSLSKLGQWAGMLFADRGIFRPGETAKVSGIVRVAEPTGLRTVPGRDVRVELRDTYGEQIFDGHAPCDEYGTFALDVAIPKNAQLGVATLTATAAPGGKSRTLEAGVFTRPIKILAFTPDEFKVTVEADKPSYIHGDTALFSTTGEYLYGAPMPGAAVSATVTRQEVPFTPPGADGFATSDDTATKDAADANKAAQTVESAEEKLDDAGRLVHKVPLAFADQTRPERVNFDVDVQDLSHRVVSARAGVVVHPGEFYVAVRNPVDRFAAAGTAFRAEVLAVEPSGAHRAGVKVSVDLVERKWNTVVGQQPDGTPTRKTEAVDTVLSSCTAVSAEKPAACDVRVPRSGYFVLRAVATDPRGNKVRASTGLYGTEVSPQAPAAWAGDDHNEIKLEANKTTYAPGETAKILLRSPFHDGEALVTVERNGILWQTVAPIHGPLPVVSVPIAPEFYPNAFVSVVAVRGRIQAPPASGADLGGPQFRLGYLQLNVDPDAHRLHVAVTAPKKEYPPGDMVEADVTVTDKTGKGAPSTLTFYVVDEGVLALTSYKTPDPLPAFVQGRKLAVFALDNRELLARILPMKAGERLSSLGYDFALASNGGYDKGHDGGDGDAAKRADFRTTAYFEAGRRTDAQGKAHFKFKLPDNLTTFRMMAVAAAADDRFGSGDSSVTTFRHLMARPALPHLLRVGDSLEASVIVSSKADGADKAPGTPMKVDVRLDVKGLDLKGPNTRTVSMPRGGQTEVRFPVVATTQGDAFLTFTVRSGQDVDKVEMKRKVEVPTTEESLAVYGETDGAASIALGDDRLMRPDHGGLNVSVSSSALVGLGTALDQALDYPYGCTEQLASRVLPFLATQDLAKELGLDVRPDTDGVLDAAVTQMLRRQNDDGGFGYWDGGASNPMLSAYAMLTLGTAADKKRFVPSDALVSGRSYLNTQVGSLTRELAHVESDDAVDASADAVAAANKAARHDSDYVSGALAADVLSTLGYSNPAALNILFEARAGRRLFAQAALLHAMAKATMSPAEIQTLVRDIEARLHVGPDVVTVDEADDDYTEPLLESNARTLAMVLYALSAAAPHDPLLPRIARGLLSMRANGGWRTPHEDAWSLLALTAYEKAVHVAGNALRAKVYLRGRSILDKAFPEGGTREEHVFIPASDLAGQSDGLLAFEGEGKGELFYAANLRYETSSLPTKAQDEGLFVQRYVRGIAPAALREALKTIPRQSANAVTAGDLVVVDLLFESAEPRDQVVLDDPLPAGLQALDFDLDTTSKDKAEVTAALPPEGARWLNTTYRVASSHREVRDDRVITFLSHLEPGMYRQSYLARATSVGSFVTPPTRIAAMYTPEVYGRTAASTLTVKPKP